MKTVHPDLTEPFVARAAVAGLILAIGARTLASRDSARNRGLAVGGALLCGLYLNLAPLLYGGSLPSDAGSLYLFVIASCGTLLYLAAKRDFVVYAGAGALAILPIATGLALNAHLPWMPALLGVLMAIVLGSLATARRSADVVPARPTPVSPGVAPQVFEVLPDSFFAVTEEGTITWRSLAADRWGETEWVGQTVQPDEAGSPARRGIRKRYGTDGARVIEWTRVADRLSDTDHAAVIQVRDVTEQQATLARTELALKNAERRSEAKGELLANVSHEIRTPMNGILGMSDLLLDTSLSAEQREYVETITTSSRVLMGVLDDILSYTEADAPAAVTVPFDVQVTVAKALRKAAVLASRKSMEVAAIWDDVPQRLCGDVDRVTAAIEHLASASIRTSSELGVAVGIAVRQDGEHSGSVLRLVFETQGLASIGENDPQAAVSLMLGRRLIGELGGTLNFDNSGRAAVVELPLASAPDDPSAAPYSLGTTPALILVTASPILSDSIASLADSASVGFDAFDSLSEAADAIKASPMRSVVLDTRLPDAARFAAALHRAHPTTRIVPLFSPDDSEEDRAAFGKAARSTAVEKPVSKAALLTAIASKAKSEAAVPQGSTSPNPSAGSPSPPLNVLVAEDNLVNLKVVIRMLQRFGIEAVSAPDGLEALRAVQAAATQGAPFDLVLMDIQMPVMDGLDSMRAIRASVDVDTQPFISALTANTMHGDRDRCFEAGADDYLTKPLNVDELKRVLAAARKNEHRLVPA